MSEKILDEEKPKELTPWHKSAMKFGFGFFPTESLRKLENKEDLAYFGCTYFGLKVITAYTFGLGCAFYFSRPVVYQRLVAKSKRTIKVINKRQKKVGGLGWADELKLKACTKAIE